MMLKRTLRRRLLLSFIPAIILVILAGFFLLESELPESGATAPGVRFAIFASVVLSAVLMSYLQARSIAKRIEAVAKSATAIVHGQFDTRTDVAGDDEVGQLGTAFNQMAAQLNDLIENREVRIGEHTRAIEASAEISRQLSTILNPDELTTAVVEQLKATFNYYHAQIYLLDGAGENLVMAGGTGDVGKTLLAQNHHVLFGKGLVGNAAAMQQPILVPDVSQEPRWLSNPLLPHTKAEAAVPILRGDELIGVLDVQNDEVESLGQRDVELLDTIASQVAVALQNAALFAENEQSRLLLQKEKEQAQIILERMIIPLTVTTVEEKEIVYVNKPFTELIRMPEADLINLPVKYFGASPAKQELFLDGLQQKGEVINLEVLLERGDGERFWAFVSAKVINFQGQTAVLTTYLDINERKLAEAQTAKLANELSTVAEVGTVAATILEPHTLLQSVVDLTKERFGLYHAHILLLNEPKNALVLMAGAANIGQQMVEEGRQIPLAAQGSLTATAAREKRGAIRNYSAEGEGFMPHPLLAETRSELAVPIMLEDEVLGVLDVRSKQQGYFNEADMQTYTTLASQVAVALQNARSFARSEQALKELQELSRRLTREGWHDYVTQQASAVAVRYDLQQPAREATEPAEAAVTSEVPLLTKTLQIQGEPIGQLKVALPKQDDEAANEIVAAVAERLSVHLENLRLAEQSEVARANAEKRGQEMAVINNIVTQISASLDLQHSLQIIVDELATAVNVDQVRVALLQPDGQGMLIIAEHYDAAKTTSALGATIPVEGNALTQQVLNTRELIVVEDAQNNPLTEPVHELFKVQGIETVIIIPLVVNDEVIGTIGLDILDKRPIEANSLQLAETIVYQAATAVQNARLFEQTQSALAETELLYACSTQLNEATNLDAVLKAAVSPALSIGAKSASLLVLDQGGRSNAELGTIVAATAEVPHPINTQYRLPAEFPLSQLWTFNLKNVLFVSDVDSDSRLQDAEKHFCHDADVRALILMFLTVGNLRLGQITVYWDKPQTFTPADERLYGSIAQQAASVVYNRMLFNQTEEALSETAALYQATTDLNTASTFDDVLTTLRQYTILGHSSMDVALNYFDRPWDKENPPTAIEVMARWGTLLESLPKQYETHHFPEAMDILKPDKSVVCEDVAMEPRMSEASREIFLNRFKAKSLIFIPLTVGGQWFGFLSGMYARPMQFPEVELRRVNVLARQAAVSIQTIHLLEQTKLLLASEQRQRQVANNLLEAASHLSETLSEDQLRQITLEQINKILLPDQINFYDWQTADNSLKLERRFLAAEDHQEDTFDLGQVITQEERPELLTVLTENSPLLQYHEGEDGLLREHYALPWFVGGQIAGLIEIYHTARHLTIREEDQLRCEGVVRQAAIAIQNARLYEQTQAALAETEALYDGLAHIVHSSSEDDVLQALINSTVLKQFDRAYIFLFDRPLRFDESPGDVTVAAEWRNEGVPPTVPIGMRFPVAHVPFISLLNPEESMIVKNIFEDERIDDKTGAILEQFDSQSFVVIPLFVGNQWLGVVSGLSSVPVHVSRDQIRQANSLVSQATVVMQTANLFRQEQARAHREQLLREIAAKIRSSTDIDTIMRTAVTEIGRTLGRRSFIKLEENSQPGNGQSASRVRNGATS